jgi:general secretion pathway protein C
MADSFPFVSSLAPRAIPWLGKLATLAVIALLAWLGARLFWSLTAPATPEPAIAVDTDPSSVAQTIAARHLFGEAPAQETTGAIAKSAANIKLLGVVAPVRRGQIAIAILSSQGKPAVAVRVGEEILPGVVLHRVLPRSVEIDQAGRILLLTLPEVGKT